jgi:Lon protease-like protein
MGCTATVEKVLKRYNDGRLDLLAIGRRRFEIFMLNDEKNYLRGAVEFFDDEPEEEPAPEEVRKRALDGFRELSRLDDSLMANEPEASDPQLSFQIAQGVPDLDFRQELLATRSESSRLRQIVEFLPGYLDRQKKISHIREVAPRNGHGGWQVP